jgi:hypothetical protein
MEPQQQLEKMLSDCGASLLPSRTKHKVYVLPGGARYVVAATPSDYRAVRNQISDLKRLLGLTTKKSAEQAAVEQEQSQTRGKWLGPERRKKPRWSNPFEFNLHGSGVETKDFAEEIAKAFGVPLVKEAKPAKGWLKIQGPSRGSLKYRMRDAEFQDSRQEPKVKEPADDNLPVVRCKQLPSEREWARDHNPYIARPKNKRDDEPMPPSRVIRLTDEQKKIASGILNQCGEKEYASYVDEALRLNRLAIDGPAAELSEDKMERTNGVATGASLADRLAQLDMDIKNTEQSIKEKQQQLATLQQQIPALSDVLSAAQLLRDAYVKSAPGHVRQAPHAESRRGEAMIGKNMTQLRQESARRATVILDALRGDGAGTARQITDRVRQFFPQATDGAPFISIFCGW